MHIQTGFYRSKGVVKCAFGHLCTFGPETNQPDVIVAACLGFFLKRQDEDVQKTQEATIETERLRSDDNSTVLGPVTPLIVHTCAVFWKMQPANKLVGEPCGRTVCASIFCFSAPSPGVWPGMQMTRFNGPITARATRKATRRQRVSASDWPAEPPQRSTGTSAQPACGGKSPA